MNTQIILASGSPRRKQLLEMADIPFTVMVKETAEHLTEGLAPGEQTIEIARQKAMAVKTHASESSVLIAADTVVVLEGAIIGKPIDRSSAVATLQKLSGHKHQVITGVYLEYGNISRSFFETTEVEFYPLQKLQIEYYIDTYKPYDKAGAYAIQEWIGVVGVKAILGDFYNVMGLPIGRVLRVLGDLGCLPKGGGF